MKETGIGVAWPAGRFDKSLNIVEGNNELYELMESKVHSPLYKRVHTDDRKKLEKALGCCQKADDLMADTYLRMKNGQGTYAKYVINIRQCKDKKYFYLEFFNMSEDEERVEWLSKELELARDYLTLAGEMLSEYYPASDTFRLCYVNHEQTVDLYHTGLQEWKELVLQKKLVKEEDTAIFTSFCEAMKKTGDMQTHSFSSSLFTKTEHYVNYRIKLLPRSYGEEMVVIGIWSAMKDNTNEEYDNFVEDSYIDSMTRLLNKKAITEYVHRAVEGSRKQLAIAVMDVDNFKNMNDTYGHMFGDQVIKAAADVIKKVIGNKGVAGRIGGDEFMFVLEEYEDEVNLRNYLRSIRVNIAALFQDKLGENGLSCSIGVARSDIDGGEFKDLFKIADKALYIAKQKGKNRYIIYKKEIHGRMATNDSNSDMLEIRKSYYSEKDIKQINRLLAKTVVEGVKGLPELLEQAANTLMVDRIAILLSDGEKTVDIASVCKEVPPADAQVLQNALYLENFTDYMYCVDNTNGMEYSNPEIYSIFKNSGVRSAMQYLLHDSEGNVKGLITADECKTTRFFPKVAVQIFENMCEIINGVLVRDENLL